MIPNEAERPHGAPSNLQVPRIKGDSSAVEWRLFNSLLDAVDHLIYVSIVHRVKHGTADEELEGTYAMLIGTLIDGCEQSLDQDVQGTILTRRITKETLKIIFLVR